MRKINITILFVLIANLVMAQNSNLVLFAEGGEAFYLVLNGIKRNDSPQTNVKVTGLPEAPYKAKVIFEDPKIPTIEKNLYTTNNMETTYSIRYMGDTKTGKELKKMGNAMIKTIGNTDTYEDKPKEYKIKLVSQVDIPTNNSNQNVNTSNNVNNQTSNTSTVTTTTSTTNVNSNTNANPNGASISMNVSINDGTSNENANIDMNVDDNVTYSESTTTTVTTTSSNNNTGTVNSTSTSNGRCDYPMDNSDFMDGKSSIESKTFADSKMTVAKQITKAHCPTAEQIRDFTKLFTFESGRLEYAKFAYDYCYDKGNYYKVNDAFDFESSIDDLNEYIEGK